MMTPSIRLSNVRAQIPLAEAMNLPMIGKAWLWSQGVVLARGRGSDGRFGAANLSLWSAGKWCSFVPVTSLSPGEFRVAGVGWKGRENLKPGDPPGCRSKACGSLLRGRALRRSGSKPHRRRAGAHECDDNPQMTPPMLHMNSFAAFLRMPLLAPHLRQLRDAKCPRRPRRRHRLLRTCVLQSAVCRRSRRRISIKLAAEGMKFTNAHARGVTFACRAGIVC